ncbi:hypothetical protein ABEB36_015581 [Hypothenemus hampei]|uniref:Zinc finger CCCH-type with G patch domain-containing protein n=1 Tax=Hypothenemus hampei TaxID=57062 RepID=A0ABD1DZI3_HYPHA
MEENGEYLQQLQIVNQALEQCPEGPERDELISLKDSIEELISLTNDESKTSHFSGSQTHKDQDNDTLNDEYSLFLTEMAKEGAFETLKNEDDVKAYPSTSSTINKNFVDLEGKKFRAPHKHPWGQLSYHNAMVCSVPPDITDPNELQVKVLFLNPTHNEMLPCPYYFDCDKDCRFSEDQCKYSHGETVPFKSLQEYIEPNFEDLKIGSEVLAKQDDNLWYRARITQILEEKCLVKFESRNLKNKQCEEVLFKDILPLERGDTESESDIEEQLNVEDEEISSKKLREELINKSLMITPSSNPLGEWEKYTKGIGSKLMQKMGYIIGTGLGKQGEGIVNPVSALVLPQGKSLDFCMNLKEQCNDPHLFNADKKCKSKIKRAQTKAVKKAQQRVKLEKMELDKYIVWHFACSKIPIQDKECNMLKEKLKAALPTVLNIASFKIDERTKVITKKTEKLKISIQQLERKHQNPKALYKRMTERQIDIKRLTVYKKLIENELILRKNKKDMSVF